jgi:hypothetical protein
MCHKLHTCTLQTSPGRQHPHHQSFAAPLLLGLLALSSCTPWHSWHLRTESIRVPDTTKKTSGQARIGVFTLSGPSTRSTRIHISKQQVTSLRYAPAQRPCTPSLLLRTWTHALALRPACMAKPDLDGGSLPANNARTGFQGLSSVAGNKL